MTTGNETLVVLRIMPKKVSKKWWDHKRFLLSFLGRLERCSSCSYKERFWCFWGNYFVSDYQINRKINIIGKVWLSSGLINSTEKFFFIKLTSFVWSTSKTGHFQHFSFSQVYYDQLKPGDFMKNTFNSYQTWCTFLSNMQQVTMQNNSCPVYRWFKTTHFNLK